jgi:hypothetical protein
VEDFSGLITKVLSFADGVKTSVQKVSTQATFLSAAAEKAVNSTFVADPDAGSKQIPAEDSHPEQTKKLKQNTVLSLNSILATELAAVGTKDYPEIELFITKLKTLFGSTAENFMSFATSKITSSTGQFGDVVAANSVFMASGNKVDILTSSEVKVGRSFMKRAGTAIRTEAPVMVDTAHSRIMFAHTMLNEADLLIHKAINLLQSVKDEFGLSAGDIGLIAKSKISLSAGTDIRVDGDKIYLNCNQKVESHISDDWSKSKTKTQVQLPQWEGMSGIPAYVSSDNEVSTQKKQGGTIGG